MYKPVLRPIKPEILTWFLTRELKSFEWVKDLSEEELDARIAELNPRPSFAKPLFKEQKMMFLLGALESSFIFWAAIGYALAAKKALPLAIQVADRWHLMENASHAFLDAVRKSMRHIRLAIGAAKIDRDLLTAAETIQYEGYLRREETNAVILGLAKDGVTIKEIVRRTGYSRGLARKVLRGERSDVFRIRESSLEVHLPWLDAQWAIGRRNGAELWRQLSQQGFRGSLRVVAEWATRRRRADKADIGDIKRTPSARTIARLMTVGRDGLSTDSAPSASSSSALISST